MYLLVPREAAADQLTLWLAAVDEPGPEDGLRLAAGSPGTQEPTPWEAWPGDGTPVRVRHREIRVTGLAPRQSCAFALEADGTVVANADMSTLPAELPTLGEKPFTVLLGSCFSHLQDQELRVGRTFLRMPHAARPDVKLMAGDQVYLDSPWYRFFAAFSRDELRQAFLGQYKESWGQVNGFARLLRSGANYFSSDDHEFWNNAPNFVAFARNTWTASGRREWWDVARALYRTFQTPRPIARFDVPPVSFLVADTRVDRDGDRGNFMTPASLAAVQEWVEGLGGPGVLVVGQPLLQTTTGFLKGTFGDWNLPDFEQYAELSRIVAASDHHLVVLTGDVHFGRIARTSLRSGKELVEIISSPLSLVDRKAEGEWLAAPKRFPASPVGGMTRGEVATEAGFAPTGGHFLTLEFTRLGAGANLRLRYWPVLDQTAVTPDFGRTIWEHKLV